jgi:hypothetical protein
MSPFLIKILQVNNVYLLSGLFISILLLTCKSTIPSAPDNETRYQLTVIAGTGGKIISPGQQTLSVKENTVVSITAAAFPGFSFARWRVLGENVNVSYANASHATVTTGNCNDTVLAEFISVPPLPAPIDISTMPTENGANFELFNGAWSSLPDFDTLKSDSAGSTNSLSVAKLPGNSIGFGVVLNSYLSIPLDGNYVFYLESFGGSALYLNDSLVLANNEIHQVTSQDSVRVPLLQGTYLLVVRYFAATSSPLLNVWYSCPDVGIDKTTIPTDALRRCDTRPAVKIIVNKPVGGEIFQLGDTIHIQWTYKNPRGQIFAQLSVNNGKSFINISNEAFPGTVATYNWALPIDADSLISSNVLVRVKEYPPYNVYGVSKKFSITAH